MVIKDGSCMSLLFVSACSFLESGVNSISMIKTSLFSRSFFENSFQLANMVFEGIIYLSEGVLSIF